jgi:hypothetical protein
LCARQVSASLDSEKAGKEEFRPFPPAKSAFQTQAFNPKSTKTREIVGKFYNGKNGQISQLNQYSLSHQRKPQCQ